MLLKSLLVRTKSSCIQDDISFIMEVLIGWKKTVLILMLLWILRMEPRCVSLLDFTCLSVSTRKISVCTGMMTSLQSLTRKQADKVREVLKRISNCIYLVSQSKLCFFKLISWMLHLIFHQGNIVFTVTQQCMWMLTQPPPPPPSREYTPPKEYHAGKTRFYIL